MKKDEIKDENWWKCSSCGYTMQQAVPPETCPGCRQKCAFTEVSCYTPECGGEGNVDPNLSGTAKR
jgi:rubredoxin